MEELHNSRDVGIMLSRSLDILQDRHVRQFSIQTLLAAEQVLIDELNFEFSLDTSDDLASLQEACIERAQARLERITTIINDIAGLDEIVAALTEEE